MLPIEHRIPLTKFLSGIRQTDTELNSLLHFLVNLTSGKPTLIKSKDSGSYVKALLKSGVLMAKPSTTNSALGVLMPSTNSIPTLNEEQYN
jgi:hypothetical protein